jgi:hypothetical protein
MRWPPEILAMKRALESSPAHPLFVYRDLVYVTAEVERMAEQLAAYGVDAATS